MVGSREGVAGLWVEVVLDVEEDDAWLGEGVEGGLENGQLELEGETLEEVELTGGLVLVHLRLRHDVESCSVQRCSECLSFRPVWRIFLSVPFETRAVTFAERSTGELLVRQKDWDSATAGRGHIYT